MMTIGRTVLIQKEKYKGTMPENYRLITCLPLLWKTLTSIISKKMYKYLEEHNLIEFEQKGCRALTRGIKDHLMLDKATMKDSRYRKTNLAMAWIDYQKAYDMVPHS